ncbi:hypothetical protein SAMN02927903_02496 [Flavobacterium caeni]|uniref:Uncharacterized protein n=1 Tax=Flavobacterium caeni TaxID=490189 RepID=A0A1G5J2J5_9FLAO|nr:hypothetical protein SAMN02927903_02496 [Flavobacterium caeni]
MPAIIIFVKFNIPSPSGYRLHAVLASIPHASHSQNHVTRSNKSIDLYLKPTGLPPLNLKSHAKKKAGKPRPLVTYPKYQSFNTFLEMTNF